MKKFDNKLLDFLYILSKQKKYLNSVKLSRLEDVKRLGVSGRTIRRWISKLEDNYMEYFPYPQFENYGLTRAFLILNDFNEEFLKFLPFKIYVSKAIHSNKKGVYIMRLAIPKRLYSSFKSFLKYFEGDFYSSFDLIETGTPKHVYKEFSKVFTSKGLIKTTDVGIDDFFTKNIFNDDYRKIKMVDVIRDNPIIVPIVFEMNQERWLSNEILDAILKNMGDSFWKYIPYKKRTNSKALKYIQKILRKINQDKIFRKLFSQIRISYGPIFDSNYDCFNFIIDESSFNKEILEIFKKRSVVFYYYPKRCDKVLVYFLSNLKGFTRLCSELVESDVSFEFVFINREGSSHLYVRDNFKFKYWKYFNPETCRWEFDFSKRKKKVETELC